jgi:hypothetical protein
MVSQTATATICTHVSPTEHTYYSCTRSPVATAADQTTKRPAASDDGDEQEDDIDTDAKNTEPMVGDLARPTSQWELDNMPMDGSNRPSYGAHHNHT